MLKKAHSTDTDYLSPKFYRKYSLIGVPVLSVILAIIVSLTIENEGPYLTRFLESLFSCFFLTVFIWLGCNKIICILDSRLSWTEHTAKRLYVQFLIISAYVSVLAFLGLLLFTKVLEFEKFSWNLVLSNILFCWFITAFMNLLTAGIYFYKQWKHSLLEQEILKKENIRSQFEMLKNQVNPHFLFNSLNTLSAIIPENQKQAVEFVSNLSDVYRYSLNLKEKDTVTLRQELDFLDSYIYLNQVRFGDNLIVQKNVAAELMDKSVVPKGLQILIENAIKHNVISKANPLTISIVANGEGVTVQNNLQLKNSVESTGIGLSNLFARYSALNHHRTVEISNEDNYFTVFLPFIL